MGIWLPRQQRDIIRARKSSEFPPLGERHVEWHGTRAPRRSSPGSRNLQHISSRLQRCGAMFVSAMSWSWIGVAVVGYWGLCRSLRCRLINSVERKFKGRDPYSLSVEEAQWVIKQLFELDCPYLARFSTAFALFRTYGILTIARLLIK
jgi:hypothetical protein